MPEKLEIYKCELCGNIAEVLEGGGAPLVCLYGTTVPEKFMPMTRRLTIIRAADFGGREMADIPVQPVAEAVEQVVAPPSN